MVFSWWWQWWCFAVPALVFLPWSLLWHYDDLDDDDDNAFNDGDDDDDDDVLLFCHTSTCVVVVPAANIGPPSLFGPAHTPFQNIADLQDNDDDDDGRDDDRDV